jgi:hypothetical protein
MEIAQEHSNAAIMMAEPVSSGNCREEGLGHFDQKKQKTPLIVCVISFVSIANGRLLGGAAEVSVGRQCDGACASGWQGHV